MRIGSEQRHNALGQRSGRQGGCLGQHHRGISGEIAMRSVFRRFERDPFDARFRRDDAVMLKLLDRRENPAVEPCKDVHGSSEAIIRRD